MDSQNCYWGRPTKLRYFPNKESSSAPPKEKVTVKDIEHLFDDLDSASDLEYDLLPLSPLPKTLPAIKESQVKTQKQCQIEKHPHVLMKVSNGELKQSVKRPEIKELESDIERSFEEPGPIQTSSPIDLEVDAEKRDNDEERTASPLLFDCGDDAREEPKDKPVPDQISLSNQLTQDGPDDAGLDTPTKKLALSKSRTPHCNNVEVLRMRADPTPEKQCPHEPELIRKTKLTEKGGPATPQGRQELQCSALGQEPRPKELTKEKSKHEGKDMSAFLKKLRDAGQSKPPCPRKPPSPLKCTPPPEPDDDFLILEDDGPSGFAIPRKADPNKSKNIQKTKAPSSDGEVSTDVGSQHRQLAKSKVQQKPAPTSTEAAQTLTHTKKGKKLVGGGVSQKPIPTTSTTKVCLGEKAKKDTSLAKVTRPEVVSGHKETPTKKNRPIGQEKATLLDPEGQLSSKRVRNKPGAWWLSSIDSGLNDESMAAVPSGPDSNITAKETKPNRTKKARPPIIPPTDCEWEEPLQDDREIQSDLPTSQTAGRKLAVSPRIKERIKSREEQDKGGSPENDEQDVEQGEGQDLVLAQSSPLVRLLRLNTSGDKVFDRVYSHTPSGKVSRVVDPSTPRRPVEHGKTEVPSKRRRKVPNYWGNVNDGSETVEGTASPPRKPATQKPQTHQRTAPKHKSRKSLTLGVPKNGNTPHTSKSLTGSLHQLRNGNGMSAHKTVKGSMATFGSIFTSGQKASGKKIRATSKKGGCKTRFPSQQQQSPPDSVISDSPAEDSDLEPVCNPIAYDSSAVESSAECIKKMSSPFYGMEAVRQSKRLSDNTVKGFKSGPSSMIEMEYYEENDDLRQPLSLEDQPLLSYSDLCGPPLRPLVLQVGDKANLLEWLGLLWPSTVQNGGQITPDHFQWFSYRSRAMGFHVDLDCDSFCNGKILLGSFMKKPLVVDHNAISVYNVLTSCVSVTINGKETPHNPGQSFLVPCGHAYSIYNMTHEPAVLYFNRMLAECTD